DRRGERIRGDSFLMLFNADDTELTFTFPPARFGAEWVKVLDTADPLLEEGDPAKAGESTPVESRSVQVHRRV
ncbi:MAG: glycogen debranching enzyme, partial [Streptosporangiaceae bacterium]